MKSELLYYGSVGLLGLIYSSVLWLVGAFLATAARGLAIFFAVSSLRLNLELSVNHNTYNISDSGEG